MRVRDLLMKKGTTVITAQPSTRLGAVVRLLLEHNIGGVPVVAPGGAPLGFVAERDVVRAVGQNREGVHALPVERIMQRPAPTCSAADSLEDVMRRMTGHRFRHLVVEERGRILGVISVGDLVKQRLEQLEMEAGVLRDVVAAQRATFRS